MSGYAEISMSEDGPGLSPQELDRIGVRGRRLDETAPGTGLGLAIAGEIISLNNGTVAFEAAPEGGVLVTVRLPLAAS
jgi:signal transduction histidine kinase